jgi:flagellar hook-associated protein 1 FlgK
MLGEAKNLSDQLNQQYESLRKLRDLIVDNDSGMGTLNTDINRLNELVKQLGPVNDSVGRLESNLFVDRSANDLRDDRDSIIKEIQEIINVDVEEHSDGRVSLYIGDRKLVDGTGYPETNLHYLTLSMPNPKTEDTHQTPKLTWDDYNDEEVALTTGYGSVAAQLKNRDYITDRMDELYEYANAISITVNDVLQTGSYPASANTAYDLYGNPGSPLFKVQTDDGGNQPASGKIISVVLTDPKKIAASTVAGETGNGLNTEALWETLNTPIRDINGDGQDNPDSALYKESLMSFANVFLGKIATDVSVAKSQANTAEGTRDMFQNAVQELSGVSMDEEMTEMMSIQRSYQAAAKLMKTIDDMLDVALTLI